MGTVGKQTGLFSIRSGRYGRAMGGPNPDRITRLRHLRNYAPWEILLIHCNGCGYEAPLDVERLIARLGESAPIEQAWARLTCRTCGKKEATTIKKRLCQPGCRHQR